MAGCAHSFLSDILCEISSHGGPGNIGRSCKRGEHMKKTSQRSDPNASQLITDMIADLGDWRGKVLARLRKVILDAAPDLSE